LQGEAIRTLLLGAILMGSRIDAHRTLGFGVVFALHILRHLDLGDFHFHLAVLLNELLNLRERNVGLLQPVVLFLQGHQLGMHVLSIQPFPF
jgi:hypothetical protein